MKLAYDQSSGGPSWYRCWTLAARVIVRLRNDSVHTGVWSRLLWEAKSECKVMSHSVCGIRSTRWWFLSRECDFYFIFLFRSYLRIPPPKPYPSHFVSFYPSTVPSRNVTRSSTKKKIYKKLSNFLPIIKRRSRWRRWEKIALSLILLTRKGVTHRDLCNPFTPFKHLLLVNSCQDADGNIDLFFYLFYFPSSYSHLFHKLSYFLWCFSSLTRNVISGPVPSGLLLSCCKHKKQL